MQLAGIDLNLLTALDALLEERNVTRAARRLGRTQPAVSHALRRLRDLLGDELLVRAPAGMLPTPRALAVRPALRAALEAAAHVLGPAPQFEPATADRTFTLFAADQVAFVLLPPLLARLGKEAPRVRIHVRPVPQGGVGDDSELAIGVFNDQPASVVQEPLFSSGFACVLRRGSAATRGRFDLERFVGLDHLQIAPRGIPGGPLDDELARVGRTRRIAVSVPHFLVAPYIVATSDLVWTAPSDLAHHFVRRLPLSLRPLPIALPAFTVMMRWHRRVDRDPGLAWLRARLHEVSPVAARTSGTSGTPRRRPRSPR